METIQIKSYIYTIDCHHVIVLTQSKSKIAKSQSETIGKEVHL